MLLTISFEKYYVVRLDCRVEATNCFYFFLKYQGKNSLRLDKFISSALRSKKLLPQLALSNSVPSLRFFFNLEIREKLVKRANHVLKLPTYANMCKNNGITI